MPGKVVTPEEWREERIKLLIEEKEHTKRTDELATRRANLPVVKISKDYRFTGPDRTVTLADIFQGQKQLILYHAMFDPSWDTAFKSCSFLIDQMPKHFEHLRARNTTLVVVSRAEFAKLEAFKERMKWSYIFKKAGEIPDHHMRGEQPGFSIFLKDVDEVYHSYSCYGRGFDHLLTTYGLLDLTPLGRQDRSRGEGLGFEYHDEY